MTAVVVLAVVGVFLLVAFVVDLQARRRRTRINGRAIAAELSERRRDLRARRSMMNLGGDTGHDPYRRR